MFITLLIVTFLIALGVSAAVARAFAVPVRKIIGNIVADDMADAWSKYMWFAVLVVGISSGVRIFELERYITPGQARQPGGPETLTLTLDRWVLEIYRTIIGSLQGIAWLLLVFFAVALIAYVITRRGDLGARGT